MGFEKFGIVCQTQESKAEEFVTYLEQGKVTATRCKKCGTRYFPPQVDCPKCLISEMEWFEVKGNGKLLTYSQVNYGPQGFEDKVPYTLAIGEFEGGMRIFSMLSREIKEHEIKIGMSIKIVPIKLPGDRVSFEFQKAQ
jgi:uncharacterized OB-fold protein